MHLRLSTFLLASSAGACGVPAERTSENVVPVAVTWGSELALASVGAIDGYEVALSNDEACWGPLRGSILSDTAGPIVVRKNATGCTLAFKKLSIKTSGASITLSASTTSGLSTAASTGTVFADIAGSRKLEVRVKRGITATQELPIVLDGRDLAIAASSDIRKSCLTPWGEEVPHGESRSAYNNGTVPAGSSCVLVTQTCNDGRMPLPLFRSCTVLPNLGIKPALAVRKSNCVLCHAEVTGDVVTDFDDNADPLSLRTRKPTKERPLRTGIGRLEDITTDLLIDTTLGIRPRNWATANVRGALYFKDVTISGEIAEAFGKHPRASISLSSALRTPLPYIPQESERQTTAGDTRPIHVVDAARGSSQSGFDKLSGFARVEINPPTESEMSALETAPGATPVPGLTDVTARLLVTGSYLTGFTSRIGTENRRYVVNSGSTVSCNGDVYVAETLVLSSITTFNVGPLGCNLYAKRDLFVKGGLSPVAGALLQLGAGRSIVLGIVYGRHTFSDEVDAELRNASRDLEDAGPTSVLLSIQDGKETPIATTRYGAYVKPSADKVRFEQLEFADPGRRDIWQTLPGQSLPTHGETCTYLDYGSPKCRVSDTMTAFAGVPARKTAAYEGVLLAAPSVHGRYHGKIKGVVVADFALFALDRLIFEADDRFSRVDALPRLGRPLMIISASSTP